MTKYLRAPLEVEAEVYEPGKGLEDGFELFSKVVTNGHVVTEGLIQFKNAEGLKNSDAALLIEEKNLNFNSLSSAVHDLLFTPLGAKLSENIRAFAKPEARDLIYRELVRLSNRELLSLVGKEEANE